ncbi:MAG: hypothetical protein QM617_09210 [Comamonas sp.]
MLTTRPLRVRLLSHLGAALPGATLDLMLSAYEIDGTDVVPLAWDMAEDPAVPGDYLASIWPNARGAAGTHYVLTAQASGQLLQRAQITVDDESSEALVTLEANTPPYPAVHDEQAAVLAARAYAEAAGQSASLALAAMAALYAYDVAISAPYQLVPGEVIFALPLARPAQLAVAAPGSTAVAVGTAPTTPATLAIHHNGLEIGHITFAAGSSTGTFAVESATPFAIGDTLAIVSGAGASALAGVGITLRLALPEAA